ncbi:MAG: IS110 family transposase [Flavobacteriales bacterium]|nr:IS110 family transposase [Flavobacteriales bacterium]
MKLKIQLGNVNRHMHKDLRSSFNRFDKAQMRTIDRSIKKVEVMIEAEIKADRKVKRQYDLISSVPGVGPVLASNLLALTDAFTRFATPRQLACHAGAAPFESTSGSSVRGRTRTSKKANSWLKSLLHMASIVAIRHDEQLGAYYRRKVAEGKPRLSAINAVRGRSSTASALYCARMNHTKQDPCSCHRISVHARVTRYKMRNARAKDARAS